jgi:PIN domain nuclease of toxin-antitoxin system
MPPRSPQARAAGPTGATPGRSWRPGDRPRFAGPALVDTHIWLWYLDGLSDAISTEGLTLLRRAVAGAGLLVSDMSAWEIGTKAAKGKLLLAPSVGAWIERASMQPGFAFVPIDRATLLASTQLSGPIHGDPVDRILIVAAAGAGVPLVTVDPEIIAYADREQSVSVCDVRR